MNNQLEEIKHRLNGLEKHVVKIESCLESYDDNMFVDLVKYHIAKVVREIGIASSFLSLIED